MTELQMKDKVAIVTGGAGGIGTCIASAYAKAGAKVVIVSRKLENLEKVAAEIKSLGGESIAIATDVCIPEQVENMVKQTLDRFGRIDVLVNNAGGGSLPTNPEDLTFENWNAIIALNLTGTFLCDVTVGKVMIQQKSGKIVNISSTAGIKGTAGMAHYGAAKAGVINLTKSLANAWAKHNINVNCVAPGLTATPGLKSLGWIPSDKNEDGTSVPPLLVPHEPEDVADLALFLGSPLSDHISGELIPIRGLVALDQ